MSAIVGPIAPYSNVPIHAEFYQPQRFVISAITLGQTTTVTTSVDHDYVIGQEVRLLIPPGYGCRELNQETGFVISIPASNQVVLTIYSLNGNPFITPPSSIQDPQIVAIGDISEGVQNSSGRNNTGTFIPGSFINVSP
jgi:hypothetical protein